jgi:hypothetical protein
MNPIFIGMLPPLIQSRRYTTDPAGGAGYPINVGLYSGSGLDIIRIARRAHMGNLG